MSKGDELQEKIELILLSFARDRDKRVFMNGLSYESDIDNAVSHLMNLVIRYGLQRRVEEIKYVLVNHAVKYECKEHMRIRINELNVLKESHIVAGHKMEDKEEE